MIWEIEQGGGLTGPQIGRGGDLTHADLSPDAEFFERYDYFVLPVCQVPPFDLNQQSIAEINGIKMETYRLDEVLLLHIDYRGIQPISVPAGFPRTAAGRHANCRASSREWPLLQMAYAFEQATECGKRRPPLE